MANAGHIKVALTTNSLTQVDADFASAKQILFYDVCLEGVTFLDAAQFDGRPNGVRGPGGGVGCSGIDPLDGAPAETLDAKLEALKGCGVLFTCRISDFAAVKVHAGNTFPVKLERKREITEVLSQIHTLITTNPPRWLRKKLAMPDVARPWQVFGSPAENVAV